MSASSLLRARREAMSLTMLVAAWQDLEIEEGDLQYEMAHRENQMALNQAARERVASAIVELVSAPNLGTVA